MKMKHNEETWGQNGVRKIVPIKPDMSKLVFIAKHHFTSSVKFTYHPRSNII